MTDAETAYLLEVHNGALFATPDLDTPVEATVSGTLSALAALACDHLGWHDAVRDGSVRIDGDLQLVEQFFGLLDRWPCPLHPLGAPPSPSLQENP